MITFSKIEAAEFAISKRLQGYHLLKNPKGASQTEVNMIKSAYSFDKHCDDIFEVSRIRKIFNENESRECEKKLSSKYFFDPDKKEMSKPLKKQISYISYTNGKVSGYRYKTDITWDVAMDRKIPVFSRENSLLKSDSEYDSMIKSKKDAEKKRGYYKTKYSTWQKIVSLGMPEKVFCPKEDKPNFFKVLYQNLTNKG